MQANSKLKDAIHKSLSLCELAGSLVRTNLSKEIPT